MAKKLARGHTVNYRQSWVSHPDFSDSEVWVLNHCAAVLKVTHKV